MIQDLSIEPYQVIRLVLGEFFQNTTISMKVFSTGYAIIYQNLLVLCGKTFRHKIAILRVFDHWLNNNSRGKKVLRMSKEQQ